MKCFILKYLKISWNFCSVSRPPFEIFAIKWVVTFISTIKVYEVGRWDMYILLFMHNSIQGDPSSPPKNWHTFVHLNFTSLISSNIDRFSNLFHCLNKENICNNTVTQDPTTPKVCRYTTLWNAVLFDKLDTAKMHRLDTSNVSVVSWYDGSSGIRVIWHKSFCLWQIFHNAYIWRLTIFSVRSVSFFPDEMLIFRSDIYLCISALRFRCSRVTRFRISSLVLC